VVKVSNGYIRSITASKNSITFEGFIDMQGKEGEVFFYIFEIQPYESLSNHINIDPSEVFSFYIGEESPEFNFSIKRYRNDRDRIYSKFKILVKGQHIFFNTILDGVCYVTNLDGISIYNYEYPTSHTIKGLQVNMVDDAVKLGIGHAALNLNLPTIMLPYKNDNTIVYIMDGKEFYFNKQYIEKFDNRVKELSDHNIVVNLILLNSVRWDGIDIHPEMEKRLLHPDYSREGFISAFNVVSAEGLEYYKAFIEFVVERYTRPDQKYGRACGFIIGNEVNSQWIWYNSGEKAVESFVKEYSIALRTAFYAARKKYSQARIYISLDHFWTLRYQEDPLKYYGGKEIIDMFNRYVSQEGNFDWAVAYHPYPENLFHPDFWNDKTATYSFNTGRITFKNIEILPMYLSQREYMFSERQRHIILSEQGFHSDESEEGERLQSAAFCLAYKKIETLRGIDSFILHAHVDNKDEFGLNLGLWTRDKKSIEPNKPERPKPIYYAFKDIDSAKSEEICNKARNFIGPEIWDSILYSKSNGI